MTCSGEREQARFEGAEPVARPVVVERQRVHLAAVLEDDAHLLGDERRRLDDVRRESAPTHRRRSAARARRRWPRERRSPGPRGERARAPASGRRLATRCRTATRVSPSTTSTSGSRWQNPLQPTGLERRAAAQRAEFLLKGCLHLERAAGNAARADANADLDRAACGHGCRQPAPRPAVRESPLSPFPRPAAWSATKSRSTPAPERAVSRP